MYFQCHNDKAWYGLVKVVSQDQNSVFVIDRNEMIKVNTMKCMPYDEREYMKENETTMQNTSVSTEGNCIAEIDSLIDDFSVSTEEN